MTPQDPNRLLLNSRAFRSLSPADAETLKSAGRELRLPRGGTLVSAGDPVDGFYVVLSGKLAVLASQGTVVLAEITPGESVGEFGLVTADSRSATVMAIDDTEVWHLPSIGFETLLQAGDPIATGILRGIATDLCERFRNAVSDGVSMVPGLSGSVDGRKLIKTMGWEVTGD